MRRKNTFFHFILITLVLFVACQSAPVKQVDTQTTITVSILPQKYFVERIAGEIVQVNVMVGPGDSPHSYEPKPSQMAALSQSTVYFRIGVEFEDAWMARFADINPAMQIIDLTQGIEKIPMLGHDQEHAIINQEEEEHGELDPHIWTSPTLVRKMAETIYQTLVEIDAQNEPTYKANLMNFLSDIDTLNAEIIQSLSNIENRKLMVFHPAWGYFCEEFGLEQIAVEIGGTEPSAAELANLILLAKQENIRILFAQPEFSTQIAEYIAGEIGGEVILISPLAEDWLGNLRLVASQLAELL